MLADLNLLAQKLDADREIKIVIFPSAHPETFAAHDEQGPQFDMESQRVWPDRLIKIPDIND